MLRSSLRTDTELISAVEELRMIRAYTSILSVCYGSRVRFEIADDSVAEQVRMPKLLLQPLIENAVKFSVGLVEAAVVSIRIRETEEELVTVVRDNGVGMPEEALRDLRAAAELKVPQDVLDIGEKGIGFKNVIARGRMHYGSRFVVDIRSAPGQGTEITMTIPIQR